MLFDSTAQPATPVCPDSQSYAGISVSPHDRHQQSHHMSLCFLQQHVFGGLFFVSQEQSHRAKIKLKKKRKIKASLACSEKARKNLTR